MPKTRNRSRISLLLSITGTAFLLLALTASAQQTAKRLILKDGSYQLVTKYEVKGDRVRYLSAERNEWEEVPNSLVDWAATNKFEKDRATGAPVPEAVELDKETAADRAAQEAKLPQVAPGLRVPADGGVLLLDTFQSQPQLVELQQSGGELADPTKRNVFRAAVSPVAGSKQAIELKGLHAKIQAHTALPAIYINPDQDQDQNSSGAAAPELDWDRFRVVHLLTKQDKRIIGDVKVTASGKVSQEQSLVPTTAEKLTGGWVKVTPKSDLAPGEYAVVEVLGKEGINTYVWDFGVDPAAPENAAALKPEPPTLKP
ncbi:MAG: hypothetical protein WB421_16215 [Terriglobales bacterium]